MKLKELFSLQKELRAKIDYNETDKLKCLFTAFLVELGECLNEWKGFKFWSTKRWSPNTRALKHPAMWEEDKIWYNPLLEEYVDGFHFLLELGIELKHEPNEIWAYFPNTDEIEWDALCQVDAVIEAFYLFKKYKDQFFTYEQLMQLYLGLGQLFGFSENQIYTAYLVKNKVNHTRQESGY